MCRPAATLKDRPMIDWEQAMPMVISPLDFALSDAHSFRVDTSVVKEHGCHHACVLLETDGRNLVPR
jgi:hypothetical protein